jgi:hypothetical protein
MTKSNYVITSTPTPNSIVQRDNAGSFTTKQILATTEVDGVAPLIIDTTVEDYSGNLLTIKNTPFDAVNPILKVGSGGALTCATLTAQSGYVTGVGVSAGVYGVVSSGGGIFYKTLIGSYESLGSIGINTTLDFTSNNVISLTPTASITLSASVPSAGALCTILITTTGTTSRTITFNSTSFRTTGTLATGIVSARVFTLSFISDGTKLNETARTTAMA